MQRPATKGVLSEAILLRGSSEKSALKISSKFTVEHWLRSEISIKLLSNFIEIALRHGCSPVNLQRIFRTPFNKNISGGLLLTLSSFQFFFSGKEHHHKNNHLCKISFLNDIWSLSNVKLTFWWCLHTTCCRWNNVEKLFLTGIIAYHGHRPK